MRRLLPLLPALAVPGGAHAAVVPLRHQRRGRLPQRAASGLRRHRQPLRVRRAHRDRRAALLVERAELYGSGDCAADTTARRFALSRSTIASAIAVPDMSFQNRPTFQQTVSVDRKLPR